MQIALCNSAGPDLHISNWYCIILTGRQSASDEMQNGSQLLVVHLAIDEDTTDIMLAFTAACTLTNTSTRLLAAYN
jgi:hypothetical protein